MDRIHKRFRLSSEYHRLCSLLPVALILFSPIPLIAQVPAPTNTAQQGKKNGDIPPPGGPEKSSVSSKYINDFFLRAYKHRFFITFGPAYRRAEPEILSETSDSWFINSLLNSLTYPDQPVSIPINRTKTVTMLSMRYGASYSWKNRLTVAFNHMETGGSFGQASPTSLTFYSPSNSLYYFSLYQGVRLLEYLDSRSNLKVSYKHPIFSWLRLGPVAGYEEYRENNLISFGSYSRTRADAADPLVTTWGIGGDVHGNYRMKGYTGGLVMSFQPLKWLEGVVEFGMVQLKGDFIMSGNQILQRSNAAGDTAYLGMVQYYAGKTAEKGIRWRTEGILHLCRFSIHIGVTSQEMKRQFSSYFGTSISNTTDYSYKTPWPVGIGETMKSHPSSDYQIYLMVGSAFFPLD